MTGLLLLVGCVSKPVAAPETKPLTSAEILAATNPADWRPLDPENTLYLDLPKGRVIIELAPDFAPLHAANIRALARERYFDGLWIIRSQDNYVAQWGDPEENPKLQKPVRSAKTRLPPEFSRDQDGLEFAAIPDGDVYADETGHSGGFQAARGDGRAWLTHCYGALGVSRDDTADSGSGAGLYVVTGHAPRHLDRNITLAGRVVKGMELLSSLPRGTGPLGFYEKRSEYVKIRRLRVAADLPPHERTALEVLRTGTPRFAAYAEARRFRRESWFLEPTGKIDICNLPVPVRPAP